MCDVIGTASVQQLGPELPKQLQSKSYQRGVELNFAVSRMTPRLQSEIWPGEISRVWTSGNIFVDIENASEHYVTYLIPESHVARTD